MSPSRNLSIAFYMYVYDPFWCKICVHNIVIFLYVDVQFFQQHCWKDYPFSFELPLLLYQRSVDYICVGLFLGFPLCSIYLLVCFCSLFCFVCMLVCLITITLQWVLKKGRMSVLWFHLQNCVGSSECFFFPYKL